MEDERQKQEAGIPENAFRELKPGEEYSPVMRPDRQYPEVTPYSVIMGLVMAIIFSAAAAYLGLKVGQVFFFPSRRSTSFKPSMAPPLR